MATKLTFYASLAVVFVFCVILSLPQQLLVTTGGLLGAAICRSNHKRSKKASCAVYFNPHLLVSIKNEDTRCIFPKANGCAQTIKGEFTKDFKRRHEALSRTKGDRSKLRVLLGHMVELRLCSTCMKLEGIEDCVKACVDKWLIEVDHEPSTTKRQVFEEQEHTPMLEKDNVASIGTEKPQIRWDNLSQNLPGAYLNTPRPGSTQYLGPRTRGTSSEQKTGPSPECQPADIAPDASVYTTSQSTPADPQSLIAQMTMPQPTGPSRPGSPFPSQRSTSTRASTPIAGWCLIPYTVQTPETLHKRISTNLQDQEIESGTIYILRRDDDEEYYKVGYSERDAQKRLKEHIAKCGVEWEMAWNTDRPIKHAKRVEKLIHIECGFRGIRYKENFCKNGGEECTVQHKEIIKAPYEDVKRCVEYWSAWMNDHDRYEKVPHDGSGVSKRRVSKGSEVSKTIWKLTDSHEDLKIHNVNDEFCLTSTGESWVESPKQQKLNGRRKSTPASLEPKRPHVLQELRKTQSARPPTSDIPSFDTQDGLRVPMPSPTPSASTKSRRSSKLAEAREDAQEDNSPNSFSPDASRVTKSIDREATPQAPPALAASSTNAPPRFKIKRSDAIAWPELVDSPAVSTSRKQKCGTCSQQESNFGRLCTACLTPEPDDEDPYVSCESRTATNLGAFTGRRK